MAKLHTYPLKFHPVLEKPIWSGKQLSKFREIKDNGHYGTSWEVSVHENAENTISNGEYEGKLLSELVNEHTTAIVGSKIKPSDILRISYIDAGDNLSVQVHPSAEPLKQNEIWYVLNAPERAEVILGVNSPNINDLHVKLKQNAVDEVLVTHEVSTGDFIYIPGGLVHAITSGVTVLEVGQNHDNTYRLYDYDRGREIHIKEALKVTDVQSSATISKINDGIVHDGSDFTIEVVNVDKQYSEQSNINHYYVYTNVGDDVVVKYAEGKVDLLKGESVLIPATLGPYSIEGSSKLIKSYINK